MDLLLLIRVGFRVLEKLGTLQIVEGVAEAADVDEAVTAIEKQSRIIGVPVNRLGENRDRFAITAEVSEAIAGGESGVGAVRLDVVRVLRLCQLVLSLFALVRRQLRYMQRLAEERHRLDIRRQVLLGVGNRRRRLRVVSEGVEDQWTWGRVRTCSNQQSHSSNRRESPHYESERRARAVASTSCCVFMTPKASLAKGTA